jgi:uncharacterized membrane protein (DUF106 family)
MSIVNAGLRGLFDVVLFPFRALHPLVALTVLSVLVAMGMLWIFKRTSDQDAIAATKRKIQAGVFEIRLFNDDVVQILRAQGGIFRHNLRYFGLSLVPLGWMIVPFILVMAQMQLEFGYKGFEPGSETLVRVELADDWRTYLPQVDEGERPTAELTLPEGAELVAGGAWLPANNELVWKVRAADEGSWNLGVRVGDAEYAKTFHVGGAELGRRSPVRHAGFTLDRVLLPGEPSLPSDGPVKAIRISYPDTGSTAGAPNWLWLFFLLSIVFAFALKGRFGVTI